MQAFHGDQAIKEKYMTRVRLHREADQLVHGVGWENGKGCAIGCTLEAYDHGRYETELGIPRTIAKLEDRIFEGLNNGDAQAWPEQFLEAIIPGADLSLVWYRFMRRVLGDDEKGTLRLCKREASRDATLKIIALFDRKIEGDAPTVLQWREARDAAYAAYAAAAAAAYAAYAAAYAAAAAAAYAAYAAAYAAAAAAKHYQWMRDILLEELRNAPVLEKAA